MNMLARDIISMIVQSDVEAITGAKAVIQTLKNLGVDTIFGYPGGMVLALYDELYRQKDIKHILVRHEQSAVHAAEGYARASGKCGVVLVTSGPGATNTVTGIVNAYLDGYPLIVLAGQVEKNLIGKDSFQEANICDIVKSCTKAVFQLTDASEVENTIIKAYKIATSGKKGPVLIDIAKNIFAQSTPYENIVNSVKRNYDLTVRADIERINELVNNSQKPVIIAGGGINLSNSFNEFKQFVFNFNIPVVSTMMGLGAFDSDNELYMGMIGIFGDNCANEILRQSDLILSFGARFNDRITCMFKHGELENKIIQIDINPVEISKNIKAKDYVNTDIKDFLLKMNTWGIPVLKDRNKEWCLKASKLKLLNKCNCKQSNMLHSFEVIQKLQEYTKDKDVIFTSEVGQHQLWAVRNLKFSQNRKILLSGGLGTMGFGLPAAIGAAIAQPNKTVVCITGDGSLQMSLGELSVCKDYGLNIKILILNNGYLGMVRQLQEENFNGRYSQTKISNPDFIKIAESFGIVAVSVNSANKIEKALNQAFGSNSPYIIDFKTEPMETL